ncbi:MAG TPA: glycosyltransferase family 39 protein [Chthoniobacteraceae bacterium]|nr:glycosyltransferase family 39 protein [Chthoniobacteraceae bacterium]
MEASRTSIDAERRPPSWGLILLYLIVLASGMLFHFASGSESSELGSHPDEAAHFVTGLMVRDYLASGFHESPLRYADEYYRHYPKIGLGIWPPVFYLAQALWAAVFHGGVATILRMVLALGVALAMVMGWWLWRVFGWVEAFTGAVLLTALPLVQQYSNMVMAETLVALLMFGAVCYFARYLEGAEWSGAIGFGICGGLAIMTKGTGLALALVPLLAILFTRRFALLKRPSLWVAALIVAVIAGPWTWHFRNQGRGGWEEPNPSLHFTTMALGYYAREICVALGWMLVAAAALGVIFLFLPRRPKQQKPAIAVCSLSLVIAVWIFQCLTPVGLEARHLMPAMPALIVLAMAGLHGLGRCTTVRGVIAAGMLAIFFLAPDLPHSPAPEPGYGSIGNASALSPFRIPRKQWGGFELLAEAALAGGQGPILVASDARGEGMFIADVAINDPHRPSYIVERASKLLASSTWSGSGYQSFYQTPGQVLAALEKEKIRYLVTDSSVAHPSEHERLLEKIAETLPPMAESNIVRDGVPLGSAGLYPIPANRPAPR